MSTPARLAGRLALAAILAVYTLMAIRFWFSIDPAWIDVRYAVQLARGLGPRFNPGDPPLEAFGSPLLVLVGAVSQRLGIQAMWAQQLVGLASGAALLALLTQSFTARLGIRGPIALGAVATLALNPMFGAWASGLPATLLGALLIYALYDRWVLARAPWGGAGVALALLVTRADSPAWIALVAVIAAAGQAQQHRVEQRPLPARARASHRTWLLPFGAAIGGVALALAALTAGRLAVFGAPVPWSIARWSPDLAGGGLYLFAASVGVGLPPLWAISVGFSGGRRGPALPLLALCAAGVLAVLLSGGESEPFGRLILPIAPFGTAIMALAAEGQARAGRTGTATWLLLFAALFGHLPAWDVPLAPRRLRQATDLRPDTARTRTEIQQWRFSRKNAAEAAELARAVADAVPPDASWSAGSPGVRSVFSDLTVYDLSGRTDPAAHAARTGDRAPRSLFRDRHPTVLRARLMDFRSTAEVLAADWEANESGYSARVIEQPSGNFLVILQADPT